MQMGKKKYAKIGEDINKSRKVTETTVKFNAFGINDSFLQDVLENFEKSLNEAKFYLQYAAIIRMFGIVVLRTYLVRKCCCWGLSYLTNV